MRLSPRTLLTVLVAALPLVSATSNRYELPRLLSEDARSCFLTAMDDSVKKPRAALARLESLILPNPVTVGIDDSTIPGDALGFQDGMEDAIKLWRQEIEDSPFVQHREEDSRPTVLVQFVRQVPGEGRDVQGLIEAQHEYRWSRTSQTSKMTCTMYVVYHTNGRMLVRDEVKHIVAHELGHLLGLADIRQTDGLMGPFIAGRKNAKPSADELDCVVKFRDLAKTQYKQISARL